jgi:Ca2+-transporting ATPase
MRTLQEVIQAVPTSPETGLSPEAVSQSRQKFGSNALTPLPREPLWKKFLEKFDEPIIQILLAAALLSMFVDIFRGHPEGSHPLPGSPALAGTLLGLFAAGIAALYALRQTQWVPSLMFLTAIAVFFLGGLVASIWSIEGLAVMIAVLLATGVAFASEYKSDQEFEALNAQKESIRVKVTRGGEFHTIPLEEVVVGDVIDLETGDEVPADGRIYKSVELMIDQSLMTGESRPTRKMAAAPDDAADGPDHPGCLYRGTQVVDGAGVMIVTEVGDATMLGQIARRLSADEGGDEDDAEGEGEKPASEEDRVKDKLTISKRLTPLQLKLKHLADLISNVGYAAAGLIFLALLLRGYFVGELNPAAVIGKTTAGEEVLRGWLGVMGSLLNYFVYMVIIIVVAVPEGLPMSVTVSLALAMQKMTRANSLVRQLVACETIGSATVICSDKTGTLTQNKMTVVRLFVGGEGAERGSPGWKAPALGNDPLGWITLNAALNSTANLEEKNGKLMTVGSSTEGALLQWLREGGIDHVRIRASHAPLYQAHFSSERKRMSTVIKQDGKLYSLMKGAPEVVMGFTTHYQAADGTVKPWDERARSAVLEYLRDSARQAMRTLAFAHKELPPGTPESEEELHARREEVEAGMVFTGLVAIRDPLRDDVKDAVEKCREAGIEVKMITGDNVETARAIAHAIGLIGSLDDPIDAPGAKVLTSTRFNELYGQLKDLPEGSPERQRLADELTGLRVLARARPLDKYRMVELLQARDEVVAMTGDGTNDAPSLKKADVGLSMGIAGTEVAKEASKIVLLDDAFSTIVSAVKWGRSLYENIQRFIQFQLTINVSALTIAFLGPFLGIRPPFTVLQLLWINVIMDTFASIALCSEPPREGVLKLPPKKKDENIITPQMARTIFGTAAFFVVVMLILLIGMEWYGWFDANWLPRSQWTAEYRQNHQSAAFEELTTRQVSIFFAVYVFFQVWNQVNCRSLTPSESGFARILQNPAFLMIVTAIAVGQIALTSIDWLAAVFKVQPLGVVDWLVIIASTASVLVFAEVWRRIQLGRAGA